MVFQALAQSRIERLTGRRADAIRTRAEDERRARMGFSYGDDVRERADFFRQRVVFNPCCKSRVKPVGERVAPFRAIDLVRDHPNTVSPFELINACPAHGAAFSRSKRSARYSGHFSSFWFRSR